MKSIENLATADYLKMFRRRIWYVVVTAIVVAAGTAVYARRLPPIYKSETTILVNGRLLPNDFIASLDRLTSTDRIDFVRRQLESRTLLEKVVQEFQPAGSGASLQVASAVLRNSMEFTPVSSSAFKISYTAADPGLAQAITRRLGELVIQLNDSSSKQKSQSADQFLEDQLRQLNSEMVQKEQALLQFKNQNFGGMQVASPDTLREMQGELTMTDARLSEMISQRGNLERRLEEQKMLKTLVGVPAPPQTQRPVSAAADTAAATPLQVELAKKRADLASASSRYTPLHPEVTRLTREVKELEEFIAKNDVPRAASKPESTSPVPSIGLSPEINSTLFSQQEVEADLAKSKRDIAVLEKKRSDLAGRLSLYQRQLNPSSEVAQQLATLERDRDAAERAYKLLADKRLSSEMATRVDLSDENETFKTLDQAFLPQTPIGPNRPMYMLGGCLGGLLLGLGIAFGREFIDPSLQDEAEAAAELRMPIFAGIPDVQVKLDKKARKNLPLSIVRSDEGLEEAGKFYLHSADSKVRDVILDPLCPAGEPYRLIHTKLARIQKERGVKTILITSSVPNEGKTFAACCLAGVLARERGRKVLLIDADLRAGDAGQVLGVSEHAVGLEQLLGGLAFATPVSPGGLPTVVMDTPDILGCLHKCAEVDLHFLPSGCSSENPSQLSNVSELERLIRQAEGIFDWIVIDSPPVLALSDANLLAPLCDLTLFVVRSRKTDVAIVKDAIQKIGPDRICGLLMNRISTTASTYYNSYYKKQSQRKLKA